MNKNKIMKAIKKFQKYVATYTDQLLVNTYSENTFIDDMIYGIGISLNDKNKNHNGYLEFKRQLIEKFKRDE